MGEGIPAKKILVVDDEEQVLTNLVNILKRSQYNVSFATRGKEAISLANSQLPDLIILDIVMPDMDGGDVAAVLGKNQATANIPILFLTGILSKDEQSSVRRSGKHFVMAKPVVPAEVLEKIKKILG